MHQVSLFIRRFSISALLMLLVFSAQGQTDWTFKKEVVDSVLELQYFSTQMPGYAMCIIKDGKIVYTGVRGKSSIKLNQKMSSTTQFNIGSVTKQFTAAAIYLLEEEGKLSLSDNVKKYIPEFPDYPTAITIDQLIHHTSGIRDHIEVATLLSKYKQDLNELDGMLSWIQKYPELNAAPGTSFAYSNTNYMLLAVIIERLSGMKYEDFLDTQIFKPLGMQATYVERGKHKTLRDGTTHYDINYKQTHAKPADAIQNAPGATGVITTLEDLVKWDNNFYHNILGKKNQSLINKMEQSAVLVDGSDTHYGAGLLVTNYRFKPVIEHSGGWGQYLTQYRRFPDEGVTVIVCTNAYLMSPFVMCDNVCNTLFNYKNLHLFTQNKIPEIVSKQICGPYAAENNLIRYIYTKNNNLYIARIAEGDTTAYPMRYVGPMDNGYAFMDTTGKSISIVMEGNKPHHLSWDGGTYFGAMRNYQYIDTTLEINFYKYHGKYYCAALDKKIRIQYFSKEDELTIHPFPFIKYNLISKGGDYYQVEGQPYIVHFGNGHLLIGNDWVYNIRADKKIKRHIDLWPFEKKSSEK
ncbi:MAG TPA: serine hydrolase domain-containing protein [Chitinophagales bacterium]|nr:beta-lactamase family protein [Chitinophagales bacterium]HMU68734.1 serine hydrolase domain-containing protein [Chitinophagales bacterium]HMX03038.1 serine hydrolase domain-containing protein [Chitinophagales bacterium]HMZ88026.1 serine hydrolase domain-containing protein [Chitinophagales bacterium]HNE44953.1 serine hydrolase domain-containing protein [Chitinophagales bacterium]